MTTKEMRKLAADASNEILAQDDRTEMSNKLVAVLWTCCAEICDRLDFIADDIATQDSRVG